MDLIMMALSMLLALLLLVARIGRQDTTPSSNTFNPNWGGSYPSRASHERAAMRKQYAETGLPPAPRHPYFDYLHSEAKKAS